MISLTDSTKAAQLVNACYQNMRDTTLRMHPWNFAVRRVSLTPLTTAPVWTSTQLNGDESGANLFQIPGDCLRILSTDNPDDTIIVEGRQILYATGTLNLRYITQVTDPNQFDAMFTEAYTTRIAMQICMGLTQSKELFDAMTKLYGQNLSDARAVNSFEQGTNTIYQNDLLNWRV